VKNVVPKHLANSEVVSRNNSSQMICQRYTCLAFDETGASPYFSQSAPAAQSNFLSCEVESRRVLMAAYIDA